MLTWQLHATRSRPCMQSPASMDSDSHARTVVRMQFRPEVRDIAESPLVQIATLAEATPGTIKLCYGESDLPTPEFICRAAYDASLAGHTFYTHTAGYAELREAIAQKILELH